LRRGCKGALTAPAFLFKEQNRKAAWLFQNQAELFCLHKKAYTPQQYQEMHSSYDSKKMKEVLDDYPIADILSFFVTIQL